MAANLKPTTPPAASGESLCELHAVNHDFLQPNGQARRVLDNVTLAVKPDEIVALLGPSGCGKSTILRILAGLFEPTSGRVSYHGKPLHGLNPGVAIVFQSFALYPWMTVTQNIRVVLKAAGMPLDEIEKRTNHVIRLVGLAGFEDTYPRELSGGMKQRVGMARALSVDPEILMLDEPFSQVDALTAESLRSEVIDIWSSTDRNPSSILMVSHDIKEVAYMADRIVILGANPGVIRTIVENKLPRPRDYRSFGFTKLVDQLHELITGIELPDEAPTLLIESLPDATGSEIIGLLEYLAARGGREDVFRIAADTHNEFGHVINIVEGAEMLGFVDTPKRNVVLEAEGLRFVAATADEQKGLWRKQLLELRLFKIIYEALLRTPEHEIDKDFVLETILLHLPQENYEKMFQTIIRWSRYGNLFSYDENTEMVALQEESQPLAS